MRNVTSGTRLPDGTVVIQGDAFNMNKLRCMSCHSEAIQQTKPNGKKVFRCTACGREWIAKKF
jgi:hypothetical protein